jgi:hypothetical protein
MTRRSPASAVPFALAAALVMLPLVAAAQVGINPMLSWVEIADAVGPVSVLIAPDGAGLPLDQAFREGGAPGDATIHVYLRNDANNPIAGVRPHQMALAVIQALNGVQSCRDEMYGDRFYVLARPDEMTDEFGHTTISMPLRAGGWDDNAAGTNMVVAVDEWGLLLPGNMILNGPDLDGDGAVNLTDTVLFAMHYHGEYAYRADFNYDQAVDLADLVVLAGMYGAACP